MSSSPQLSTSVNAEKLVNDLKECIDELSSDFTNSALPIDDDSQICQRLCVKLEQFFLLGLNEKSSLFGRKKFSYWDFFKASLTLTKGGVDSALRFANYNPEVRTSVGKGRAFLRYCLVHGCLADAIQQSLMTAQILATWYSESAPMRNDVLAQELVSATYALCDVNFDLAPGGHDLDGEWPTCRRHFGSPSRSWKPLSRSTSFASLASSSFSLDPGSPPPVGSMGAMGSLPEGSQQEIRSTANTLETSRTEDDSNARQFLPTDQVKQFMEEHREEVKSLIEKYETEIKQLSDNNFQLQQEVSQLRLEKDCVVSDSDSSGQEIENLKSQVLELNNLNDKLVFYEGECQRLQSKLQENEKATRATIKSQNEAAANQDTEMHELKMKLLETQSENNTLKTHLSSMEVECSKMTTQLQEFEEIKASLESTESRSRKYREQLEETGDLRKKLAEVREDYERVVEKLRTEETRWAAEMEQKVQQAKWEMGSLQKCVDNLLKENGQLRDDLTKASTTMTESRDKYSTNELYVQKLTEQVTALKDVVSIGKQMLGMRDTEVAQLQKKVQTLEDLLEAEREKNTVFSEAFRPESIGDINLRKEYENQLDNIKSLKTIYAQRIEIITLENEALKEAGTDRDRQIELMGKRYKVLEEQYERMKVAFDEKVSLVADLQSKIASSAEECKALTSQLTMISNLFAELGKSEVDAEKLKTLQEAVVEDPDNSSNFSKVWGALSEVLENNPEDTQPPVGGSESCYKSVNTPHGPQNVISVSQTFLRLKDLILEKKSLERELGQLRNLNGHLETKLHQQERRLSLVLQELKKTWGVVNKMRTQHSQLRSSEAILRYDLQQKRKIVNELKEELQHCNDIWKKARNKTKESEETWKELKNEFVSRRRGRPLVTDDSTELNSAESGFSDDRGDDSASTSEGEDTSAEITGSERSSESAVTPDETSRPGSSNFTESTISDENENASSVKSYGTFTPRAASEAAQTQEEQENLLNEQAEAPKNDIEERLIARDARLTRMEEQASQLFRDVVRTSNMSVAISNRLEELHEQYGQDTEEAAEARRLHRKEKREAAKSESVKVDGSLEDFTQFEDSKEAIEERRLQRKAKREARLAAKNEESTGEALSSSPESEKSNLKMKVSPPRSEGQSPKATTEKDEVAERLVAEISAKEAKEVELTQLREDFAAQSETIAQLKKDLKRMSKSLEDEVAGRDDLKDTLAVTSKECVDLIQQVQELSETENNLRAELLAKENSVGKQAVEIDQLKMDLKNLQEHVVNLVSQKEKLFKECYNLKQAHRERVWQHDSQVQHCSSCRVQFSLLVRKHHCRHCGQIFCGACSSHWLPVNKGSSRRTRSCSECHSKCQETSDTTESGECASTNPDNPTASDVRQDSDDDDEDFSVISEDDVNLSQCVPYTPNPEILQYWQSCEVQSGMTKRVAEMLGHNSSSEVWVRAGVIYSVPILVNAEDLTPQVNITWQFSTEPNCIAFSILYKPDADVPPENSSILVPTTRVNSHLHPIRGKLKARKEGLYTLLFDNSYSRFTGKKLQYSLVCDVGAGSGRSSAEPESPARAVSRSPSKDFKPIADST
ncbi:FYVE and coiled-coil domain-containing protein 1-like isoform X1 [Cloeon dipterum]|uniref:FYVE and coiled-coil domain-containing protein 1-like isoform X1 n=2 Tax=Cloeon dipterum TaxID=197152 RepID=UPI00321FCEAF